MDPLITYLNSHESSSASGLYERGDSYKEYARFPKVILPAPHQLSQDFSTLLEERVSNKDFSTKALTSEELSSLLYWSAGLKQNDSPRRHHPSGGALYPLELYVVPYNVRDIVPGIYHYNIKDHALEHLIICDQSHLSSCFAKDQTVVDASGALIIMSFIKERMFAKYSACGYKLAFLEAGHISQNIYLGAAALGIASCALGVRQSSADINEALELDGINESAFYALCIGSRKR